MKWLLLGLLASWVGQYVHAWWATARIYREAEKG